MTLLRSFLRSSTPVPQYLRRNFFHFYMDVAWYGILNGSALSFVAIYASRLGADPSQIGLISAAPAVANLLFALPAGEWLSRRPIGKLVFWSAVISRIFYLAWLPLPLLFSAQGQIWALILIIMVLSIPGTLVTVGINVLIADAVPGDWRAQVVGIRNGVVAIVSVVTSLVCGQILVRMPFPVNYQIVFGLGFAGAMLSTIHLYLIKSGKEVREAGREWQSLPLARPTMGEVKGKQVGLDSSPTMGRVEGEQVVVATIQPREEETQFELIRGWWTRLRGLDLARLDIIKGPYGRVMALLFGFHLAQFFGIPIFPPYFVNELHFNDQVISFGTSLFNGLLFIGSTQLARVTRRFGNKKATGLGVVLLALYPLINAAARNENYYYAASIIGGLTFAVVGGAVYNYLLEKIPADDRPPHLAWYNLALNGAILLGSISGPFVANQIGFINALLICALARALAGAAILRWG